MIAKFRNTDEHKCYRESVTKEDANILHKVIKIKYNLSSVAIPHEKGTGKQNNQQRPNAQDGVLSEVQGS